MPSFATSASLILAMGSTGLAQYTLLDDYFNGDFFDKFTFWSTADPTNGFVDYQSRADSLAQGLIESSDSSIIMRPDSSNVTPGGRPSVRIESNAAYDTALIVADISHMPYGCGTWPAFWTYGPVWPNSGEIDIIEGVNLQDANSATLHTTAVCLLEDTGLFTGTVDTDNCDVYAPDQANNAGCSIGFRSTNTYGDGFNDINGGVYATEWTDEFISVWFFPRGSIPSDVLGDSPNPSSWGQPNARFEGNCDISQKVVQQSIVFDLTFCGDWAGNVWSSGSCASRADTCNAFVENNPAAFADAYWAIDALKVYTVDAVAAPTTTSTSTSISTSTSTSTSSLATSTSSSAVVSSSTSTTTEIVSTTSTTTVEQSPTSTSSIAESTTSTSTSSIAESTTSTSSIEEPTTTSTSSVAESITSTSSIEEPTTTSTSSVEQSTTSTSSVEEPTTSSESTSTSSVIPSSTSTTSEIVSTTSSTSSIEEPSTSSESTSTSSVISSTSTTSEIVSSTSSTSSIEEPSTSSESTSTSSVVPSSTSTTSEIVSSTSTSSVEEPTTSTSSIEEPTTSSESSTIAETTSSADPITTSSSSIINTTSVSAPSNTSIVLPTFPTANSSLPAPTTASATPSATSSTLAPTTIMVSASGSLSTLTTSGTTTMLQTTMTTSGTTVTTSATAMVPIGWPFRHGPVRWWHRGRRFRGGRRGRGWWGKRDLDDEDEVEDVEVVDGALEVRAEGPEDWEEGEVIKGEGRPAGWTPGWRSHGHRLNRHLEQHRRGRAENRG